MCEADSLILRSFGAEGRVNPNIIDSGCDVRHVVSDARLESYIELFLLESLILAQDERWRRA
jgi:hypothetical protein